jgi:hypothetical protein
MQEIVTNGYTSPNYGGPPGNNDCTHWGRYWISCTGALNLCICPAVAVPVGTCGPFADIIISSCGSECGGAVFAANKKSGGNLAIVAWGSVMSDSSTGVGII